MTTLVIAEHTGKKISLGTLATLGAAQKLNQDITVLVAGYNCQDAAEEATRCEGVTQVLYADHMALDHGVAEPLADLIVTLGEAYTHILAPASTFGKNLLPRVAALFDVSQISDITGIDSCDTFIRPIYAGNALATVQSLDNKKVMTVRPTAFEKVDRGQEKAPLKTYDFSAPKKLLSSFLSLSESKSDRPDLTSASVVISGGRGLQSGENFKLVEKLADTLGGAIGASRAAVDAGYVPNDYQVGQTGKVVAPDLYIAIGISGAIQHLAGMKESKVIVAINKDEEAPIFQIADYGLVGDLFDIVPELTTLIQEHKKASAS